MSSPDCPTPPALARHLVVFAASSGGLDALHTVAAALPASFPAAIAVVQHRLAGHGELLRELLALWTLLRVRDAGEGDRLESGTIYIAPAELHMTITGDRTVALVGGGPINHVLSSADPLFASAALAFGSRLIAVVLTGHDGDGSAGVRSVRLHGGTVIAQDPATARCGDMPRSAIATGVVDLVVPLDDMGSTIARLVREAERGTCVPRLEDRVTIPSPQ